MIDFRTLNSFLSDYIANSGMLSFYSEKDRASYSMGTHCYVLCPVYGAKTSSEMIKGTRRFKSWQCGHLSSSSPLDFFMLAEGIKDFPVAVRKAEELMNSVPFEEKRIYHHKPDDKSLSLRKKNIELAEKAFLESDQMMTAAYLKTRGIDYCSLPEVIRRDIAYSSHSNRSVSLQVRGSLSQASSSGIAFKVQYLSLCGGLKAWNMFTLISEFFR